MKCIIFSLFFVLSFSSCLAQTNWVSLRFAVFKPQFIDSSKSEYIGSEFEFEIERFYLNDSIYYERGLVEKDKTHVYGFLESRGTWFVKDPSQKKGWKLFFNGDVTLKPKLCISGIEYILNWSQAYTGDKTIFVFSLLPPSNMSITHLPRYIFSITNGIIGIKNDALLLVREDFMVLFEGK